MKKITFMLSLLMSMGAMTTSAQVLSRTGWTVTTSGECDDSGSGHAAAIIDGNNSTYWHSRYNGGGNASGDATYALPQFFVIDLGQETSFKSIGYVPRPELGNGTATSFKLYVSNTAFERVSDSKNAASIVNALGDPAMTGTFTYADGEGQTIKTASSETELKGRYVMFVITGNKNNNGFASCAEFYLSADAAKSIMYHYMVDDKEIATKTVEFFSSAEPVTPVLPFITNGAVTKTDDNNYKVSCTLNVPFTAADSYNAETAKWYVIDIHNNQANYLWKGNDDNSIATENIGKTTTPSLLSDNYQWTFVGNFVDGYTLYNKATNKAAAFDNGLLKLSETGDVFKIAASTGSNKANGFCFYKTEGQYLNQKPDASGIATYTSADEGSTMHVQAPESYPLAYAQTYANYNDEGAPEGAIGANSYLTVAENLNAFKAAYTAASVEGATAEQIKALAAENEKVAAATTTTMEMGKYYRLYNKQHHKYACLNSNPAQVKSYLISTEDSKGASSIFYLGNAESGRYRIKVENLILGKAKRADNGNGANIELGDENYGQKGSYVISHVGKLFTFFDAATGSEYSYIHAADGGANMVGWNGKSTTYASQWYVIPATDVEIDMTAQGDKKYASAYLPFGVSNVAGATAYTGALNAEKNAIDMTATTSVPANIGFVLVGTEDKATLTIGEAAAIEGNALTGTNTGIAFAEATPKANYLVFGVNADKVGFYTPGNVTAIPANKAYINASALSASAIALNFGNTVTGINAATINNGENNAPIYDLSGRRVWAPVKGGLYIQNGKKLVK